MNADEAVRLLTENPERFLQFNALQVAGSSTLASGSRIFRLERLDKKATFTIDGPGWTRTATIPVWRASVTKQAEFALPRNRAAGPPGAEFRAFYVAMKQVDDDVASTHFLLPGRDGPSFMLTSQLTGCTFGAGTQVPGGGCLASHIQPAGGGDGKRAPGALTEIGKAALKRAVRGPLGPDATILESTGETQITVVGLRTAGTWAFLKQVIEPVKSRIMIRAATL